MNNNKISKTIVIGIIVCCSVLYFLVKGVLHSAILVVEGSMQEGWVPNVTKVDDIYYFCDENGIYRWDSKKKTEIFIKRGKIEYITSNHDYLFISNGHTISRLTLDGRECIDIYTKSKNEDVIQGIYANKNHIFFRSGRDIKCMKVDGPGLINNNRKLEEQISSSNNKFYVYSIGDEKILETIENTALSEDALFSNNKQSLLMGNSDTGPIYFDGQYVLWLNGRFLFKIINNGDKEKFIELAEGYVIKNSGVILEKDKILITGQKFQKDKKFLFIVHELLKKFLGSHTTGRELVIDQELMYHVNDYMGVYDRTTGKLLKEYTSKKEEKIIYVSLDKLVTYYKGEILFYNTENWSIVKKVKLKRVKSTGVYYFQQCGEKLFIFRQGHELLDIVDM